MKFREITKEEFDCLSRTISCKNFFQSVLMLERYHNEHQDIFLVGVEDNKKIVAGSLLVKQGHNFNAYKGPLLDYHNEELFNFFMDHLKIFVQEHDGLLLYIDPYIVSEQRDSDGNVIKDGINNLDIKNKLINKGYKYIGEYTQVKWNYCLDINGQSSKDIFKTFQASTRNNINKTLNKYHLRVRKLKYDELDEFKKITMDTCERRGFPDKSLEYYQNMYKAFKDEVVFYICDINLKEYIKYLEDENKNSLEEIDKLSDSPSNRNKKIGLKDLINGNNKRIIEAKELKEKHGEILPLSCAMFILFGDEIVYLFSGSYDEYMSFCGQYRLQWEIIKYACDNKYQRYNFYGIKDLFNPQGKDRGVYEFKKGFNGYVEELLGTFVLPINLKGKLLHLYHKIKH